ncbi:Biorientation of chromosomes in cell division protein 1-like 2 [Microtus ochrogaster]|uniref:Biorientation of chromosomes in cell division protein 1-like 2 n=1 Tax=Microtus ochrogaster TaxID=79684 RepID=A0A8J6KXH2_MICOH|nr:Biorientation of chromosomes in cell division protein 1-like 2 [Microtus ochrogaster]
MAEGAGAAAEGLSSEGLASEPTRAVDSSGSGGLVNPPSLPPVGDLRFIPLIVKQLRSRGVFPIPRDYLAEVDTKPESG